MTTLSISTGRLYIRQNGANTESSTNGSAWSTISWPCTVINSNTAAGMLEVNFITDINFTSTLHSFICGSQSIQFGSLSLNANGSRPTINVNSVTEFNSAFSNGNNTTLGYSSIIIVNLHINSTSSTVSSGYGWFGAPYFGNGATNNKIINCSTNGSPTNPGGGILGTYAGVAGILDIIGCYCTGNIPDSSGGIVGRWAGANSGTLTITECWSSGTIGASSGGITGIQPSFNQGTVIITKCFSTGNDNGLGSSGGICGSYAGVNNGTVTISNCYSRGTVRGGGIVASDAGTTGGSCTITNCYSTGPVNGGGIVGVSYQTVTVTNCYTSGTGTTNGIFWGLSSDGASNYSEANNTRAGWNSTRAMSTLGTGWVESTIGNPFELSAFGYSPYTIVNVKNDYTFQKSFTETILPNATSTVLPIGTGFSLIGPPASVTINSSTGRITSTATGTFTLTVRTNSGLSITTFLLVVVSLPTATAVRPQRFVGSDSLTTLITGNALAAERIGNANKRFTSYSDYLKLRLLAAQPR